ncbi:Domain of unknown function (DUF955) [Actinomyces succiniciruminis]|uniref:IrrE N-terminal-like domain-containing protein n=2 Tax=Actinomyces succiniciruminis TaxID=1522002 RepID=A0A1L7RLI7_9ACTO|nr:Domain of unknown function (DUF955) [Actinomyces succiniciruminis]
MVLVWESARNAARVYQKAIAGKEGNEVDPFELARALGVKVSVEPLKAQYSGFISKDAGKAPEVLLQSRESYERQRFTLAHEIGHYVERATLADDDDFSFSDLRSTDHYDLHEFYADEFAGELLMPKDAFVAAWMANPSLGYLADRFAVSKAAAAKRIDRLRKTGDIAA